MDPSPARLEEVSVNDAFVLSYPRSGNTWVRYMLKSALLNEAGFAHDHAHADLVIPDIHGQGPLDSDVSKQVLGGRRLIKSHYVPVCAGHRTVYIFRKPADVLVSSFYHHIRNSEGRHEVEDWGIDRFSLLNMQPWAEHVMDAIHLAQATPMLFVSYEALHADAVAQMARIFEHLEIEISRDAIVSGVEQSTFDKLRRFEENAGGPKRRGRFFRKGVVGDSRRELQPVTRDAIDQNLGKVYEVLTKAALLTGTTAQPAP